MKAAGKGEKAEEGIKIAVEALEGLRNRVAGAYIMPRSDAMTWLLRLSKRSR